MPPNKNYMAWDRVISAAIPPHAREQQYGLRSVPSTALGQQRNDALGDRLETTKDAETPSTMAIKRRLEGWNDVFVQHLQIKYAIDIPSKKKLSISTKPPSKHLIIVDTCWR